MQYASRGRAYLHRTGGMVSFTSRSMSTSKAEWAHSQARTSAPSPEYRPRLLTQFAVDAFTNAAAGRTDCRRRSRAGHAPLANASVLHRDNMRGQLARSRSSRESAHHRRQRPIGNAPALGRRVFRTTHPSFRAFSLLFERKGTRSSPRIGDRRRMSAMEARRPFPSRRPTSQARRALWKRRSMVRLARFVERGGKLWVGTETPIRR